MEQIKIIILLGLLYRFAMVVIASDLPKDFNYTCSFDGFSNTIQYIPEITLTSGLTGIKVEYCESLYSNNFCNKTDSIWKYASCRMKDFTCLLDGMKRRSTYRVVTILKGTHGSNRIEKIVSRCSDEIPITIKKINLFEDNSIQVQWKLSGQAFASLTVVENATSQKVASMFVYHRDGSKTIKGSDLKPCTLYTICISISKINLQTVVCCNKQTQMKYDIPAVTGIKLSENTVKNTIEFYWRDPTESSKGPFFYKCMLDIMKESSTIETIARNITHQMLSVPKPKGKQLIFTISKCTNCGCGRRATKFFPLSKMPSAMPRHGEGKKKNYIIPLIAGLVALVLLLSVTAVFIYRWRRRRRAPQERTDEPVYVETPDQIVPLHHYEEIKEVVHYD